MSIVQESTVSFELVLSVRGCNNTVIKERYVVVESSGPQKYRRLIPRRWPHLDTLGRGRVEIHGMVLVHRVVVV